MVVNRKPRSVAGQIYPYFVGCQRHTVNFAIQASSGGVSHVHLSADDTQPSSFIKAKIDAQ